MTAATAVIVVAFRSSQDLQRSLPPLLEDPQVGEVVVVDNSSDATTARLLAGMGPKVRYFDPGRNLGFGVACNYGARKTSSPVITFLNPDVVLSRNLGRLVDHCASGQLVVLGGGLAGHSSPKQILNARQPVSLWREMGRATLGSKATIERLRCDSGVVPVSQVDGALLILRRASFEALGGFDERFELYFEDVDICKRAREAGTVLMDTSIFGIHAGGASSRQVSGMSYCVFRVSRVRYFSKIAGRRGAILALLVTGWEYLVRTATRQPEGHAARLRALRLAVAEVRRPGSVRVLSSS